jgi:UPF0288 family protein (methanogenesis marker protein 3)
MMVTIHLDGERLELDKGSTLGSVVTAHPTDCAVAIIRPATQEQAKTESLAISTTAGQITVELTGDHAAFLESPARVPQLVLHWQDRYAAAFGPFPSDIDPQREKRTCTSGAMLSLAAGAMIPAGHTLPFPKPGIRRITGQTKAEV